MWPVDRPTQTAGRTFTKCISRVRDRGLKARLENVTQAVEDASAEFAVAAANHILHHIVPEAKVGGDVTTKEMEKVYVQRMAKKGAPGRGIYDELITAPAQGRCPLCGQRLVSTLDHHLPKVHYPALAVAPLNLVPACSDCNKAKLDLIPREAKAVTLHPYFDNVDDERWLTAKVVETQPAALRFRVEVPAEWDAVLGERVRMHFNTLGLGVLYAAEAAEELFNIRHQLVDVYTTGGMNEVRSDLEDRAASCARARRNGWRTAAYQAWVESDWFCNGGFALLG